jgi:hypothetical protein
MRTSTASATLLTLLLAACAGDAPTAPRLAPGAAAAERSPTPVPIAGDCVLTFSPAPPPTPLPPVVRQVDVGTCQLSHLGRTTFEGVQDINVALGTQSGQRTLTAANGDLLRTTHVGTSAPGAVPGTIDFIADITIVGGTGRFAQATGHIRGVGTATLATHTTVVRFDGWIAYDASDRSAR